MAENSVRKEPIADSATLTSSQSSSSVSKLNNSVPPKRGGHEKHAELFRKDLISAMKLPDMEVLQQDEYFLIADTWKLEWERGVQVPVDLDGIPPLVVSCKSLPDVTSDEAATENAFTLPKKLLYSSMDESFKTAVHELYESSHKTEKVCRYDLDDLDSTWLTAFNRLREQIGEETLSEAWMELIMEAFEMQCHSNLQQAIRTVDGLGIEYDENVVCDVCRSPDGEDSNEMVFCDACDICVHQACYGIQNIPEGNWLCRTCALNIQPQCLLCPKTGGAMKSTKSGTKWAHISCALWIPEVTIDCPDKMEPITNISQIPPSRWALVCSLCREREGACIQCSVKACKTSFHVTCAFQFGLDLKTTFDDDAVDVHLKAFCLKHSSKKDDRLSVAASDIDESMTDEERTELRSHRLKKLAEEFYDHVDPAEVADELDMDVDTVDLLYNYWVLKRKSGFDQPLLMPKTEEVEMLTKQREDKLIARMKMFIHLRQDLERVRNLCYMVNKREKTRSLVYQMKEDIFHEEAALAELGGEETTSEQSLEIKNVPLPPFCHHSTGTVYDEPEGILKMAKLFEERGQMLDRRRSPLSPDKLPTPVHSKVHQMAADGSLPKLKRSRQNSRAARTDTDGLPSTPAHVSPIQQLFRDKMEGLEAGTWAAGSAEVKTGQEMLDTQSEDLDESSRIPSTTNSRLSAVDSQKDSLSVCDDVDDVTFTIELEEPVGISRRNKDMIVPVVNGITDSHIPASLSDITKTDHISDSTVTSRIRKVSKSEEDDLARAETGGSNDESSIKLSALKSRSRPERKTPVDSTKKELLTKSRAAKVDKDVASHVLTRRRVNREQSHAEKSGREEDRLNSSLSQRSAPPRSGKKVHNRPQADDVCDTVTERPAESKSVRLRRPSSSSRHHPVSEKSADGEEFSTSAASDIKTGDSLQKASVVDLTDETKSENHPDPSLVSSPLQSVDNIAVKESITPLEGNSNLPSRSLSRDVPLHSDEHSRPYFHSGNFRPVKPACGHSKSPETVMNGLTSVEATAIEGSSPVMKSPPCESSSTSKRRPIKSVKRPANKDETRMAETVASGLENRGKPSSVTRPRTRPGLHRTDSTSKDVPSGPVAEKDDTGTQVTKKCSARLRRRTNTVNVDGESVKEKAEKTDLKPAENNVSTSEESMLTSCDTDTASFAKLTAAPPASTEPLKVTRTGEAHEKSTSSLLPDGHNVDVSDVNEERLALISDLHRDSKSSVNDFSKHTLSAEKLYASTGIVHDTKQRLQDTVRSMSPEEGASKSGPIEASGSKIRELVKSSTASSRKRAAHLMAGCRSRTVGVKRPPPAIDEIPSEPQVKNDTDYQGNQLPHKVKHLSPVRRDMNISDSDFSTPNLPVSERLPSLQTPSEISRSIHPLTEISRPSFFHTSTPNHVNVRADLWLNSPGMIEGGRETSPSKLIPQNHTPVPNDSSWTKDKNLSSERPPLARFDSMTNGFSGSLLGGLESKMLSPPPPLVTEGKDCRQESLRAELLRKFLPSQLIVSDAVKQRVQDGLQLLSSIRSVPTICSHTRQKLADYLNQSRKEAPLPDRLPLRPIADKLDQSITTLRRRLPARPRRRVYSEWEYVSGDELTSPVEEIESDNSDSDRSVDFEDLALSDSSSKSSTRLVRTREHRVSTVQH